MHYFQLNDKIYYNHLTWLIWYLVKILNWSIEPCLTCLVYLQEKLFDQKKKSNSNKNKLSFGWPTFSILISSVSNSIFHQKKKNHHQTSTSIHHDACVWIHHLIIVINHREMYSFLFPSDFGSTRTKKRVFLKFSDLFSPF